MARGRSDIYESVLQMVRDGRSDAEIYPAYMETTATLRATIANARRAVEQEREGDALKKRGPWPVSYEYPPCAAYPNGMKVYRVAAGHDVQESALVPMGFRP